MTSPPLATPACSAIQPALRPMTSIIIARWWDWAVVCSLSIPSAATVTAELNPKVMSVPRRSLSMVLGMPTMGTPSSASRRAMRRDQRQRAYPCPPRGGGKRPATDQTGGSSDKCSAFGGDHFRGLTRHPGSLVLVQDRQKKTTGSENWRYVV